MLEAYAGILTVIVTITGSIMSMAYFPQAYKIHKRKSSADISIITYLIFFFGTALWLLYGISINNTPVTVANIIALIGAGSVIISYVYYRR